MNTVETASKKDQADLSAVIVTLLKGAMYRDDNERLWAVLHRQQTAVTEFVSTIGLTLEIDDAYGHAVLRGAHTDSAQPRLVSRHPLPYHVSLLLALLRKRFAELDAEQSDVRLFLERSDIVDMMAVYLPGESDEVKSRQIVDRCVAHVEQRGFITKAGDGDEFEVKRIVCSFVDAQLLSELDHYLDQFITATPTDPITGDTTDGPVTMDDMPSVPNIDGQEDS